MKPICTDISDFETLRKAGQLYVDKTAYFHRLITDPSRKYFFMARPRRFGKSLCVTTLKSIFLGHREYFDDLAISRTDYDWQPHTVIHFNWGKVDASSIEMFDKTFPVAVKRSLAEAGFTYDDTLEPSTNLNDALAFFSARDGRGAVVLIDEYDDPVAKSLTDISRAETIRDRLAAIYAQFKDNSDKVRFLFITGVSKFTKLSIFSTLSSLNDITFEDNYAAMFGYTEEELEANFDGYLHAHAGKMGLSYEEYRRQLKFWYNGYRFAKREKTTVYNPVSIALTLVDSHDEFEGHWTKTGRAAMLMNYIRREGMVAIDPDRAINAIEDDFNVNDLSNINPIGMLYQTGYLTIADYSYGLYTLRVPDEEVRRDVTALLAGAYAGRDASWSASLGGKLRAGRWDEFFEGLKALYAKLPYGSREGRERKNEFSYQRPLCMLVAAQGFTYDVEAAQTAGRSDLVAEHPCGIYIFELKVDSSAQAALDQIKAKDYAAPYRAKGLPIWAIGLSFDSRTRQLVDADVEEIVG